MSDRELALEQLAEKQGNELRQHEAAWKDRLQAVEGMRLVIPYHLLIRRLILTMSKRNKNDKLDIHFELQTKRCESKPR